MTVAQDNDLLTVGLAEIALAWLQRDATLAKVVLKIEEAAAQGWVTLLIAEAVR